jgi:hypothetical protein
MSFPIEKDIPFPGARARNGMAEAIRAMEIGDSVFDPCKGLDVGLVINRQSNWSGAAKAEGRKVATRRMDGGIRVWRIA